MKIFKSFFLIALMAVSFSLHANDDKPAVKFKVQTEMVNDHALVYQLQNLQKTTTKVSITSLDGKKTFYQTNIRKHNGYREKIDMGKLQEGRYIFEVKQGSTTSQQVILVRARQIFISQIAD